MTSKTTNKFSSEVRARAVRMVLEALSQPFRRLLEWLALFLSAVLAALKTAATLQGPFKLV
jgi:hypothetical protein